MWEATCLSACINVIACTQLFHEPHSLKFVYIYEFQCKWWYGNLTPNNVHHKFTTHCLLGVCNWCMSSLKNIVTKSNRVCDNNRPLTGKCFWFYFYFTDRYCISSHATGNARHARHARHATGKYWLIFWTFLPLPTANARTLLSQKEFLGYLFLLQKTPPSTLV